MNIMTGYIGATSGDVVIDGHNILEEPELVKRQIGYLPEVPPLYTDMTVREYLDFAAELKGIGRKERAKAVRSVMEDVRVDRDAGAVDPQSVQGISTEGGSCPGSFGVSADSDPG